MKKKENNNPQKNQLYYFARYSSLAFEMLGIIILGVFGGKKLDEHRQGSFPIYTVVLSLVAVFISLYIVLKGLIKNGPKS
jgi:hypothetical protein